MLIRATVTIGFLTWLALGESGPEDRADPAKAAALACPAGLSACLQGAARLAGAVDPAHVEALRRAVDLATAPPAKPRGGREARADRPAAAALR